MKRFLLAFLLILIPCSTWAGSTATSGSTASDFITDIRVDLDEDSAGYWDDDDLVQWLDEAVWEIATRTGCLESGTSTIVLVENTRRYAVAEDFLFVHTIEYDSGDTTTPNQVVTLTRVDKRDMGHKNKKGPPNVYCVWADNIEIRPIPRSDQSGTSLYVYLALAPSGVTSTSSAIETPAYFDTAIKYFVKARALEKSPNMVEMAAAYMA